VGSALLVAFGTPVACDAGDAIFARTLPRRLIAGLPRGANWVAITRWKRNEQFYQFICEKTSTHFADHNISHRCNKIGLSIKHILTSTGLLSGVPRNFVRGGGFNKFRTEDRENGDLGAVAPYSGVLEAAVIWYKKFHFI